MSLDSSLIKRYLESRSHSLSDEQFESGDVGPQCDWAKNVLVFMSTCVELFMAGIIKVI